MLAGGKETIEEATMKSLQKVMDIITGCRPSRNGKKGIVQTFLKQYDVSTISYSDKEHFMNHVY